MYVYLSEPIIKIEYTLGLVIRKIMLTMQLKKRKWVIIENIYVNYYLNGTSRFVPYKSRIKLMCVAFSRLDIQLLTTNRSKKLWFHIFSENCFVFLNKGSNDFDKIRIKDFPSQTFFLLCEIGKFAPTHCSANEFYYFPTLNLGIIIYYRHKNLNRTFFEHFQRSF